MLHPRPIQAHLTSCITTWNLLDCVRRIPAGRVSFGTTWGGATAGAISPSPSPIELLRAYKSRHLSAPRCFGGTTSHAAAKFCTCCMTNLLSCACACMRTLRAHFDRSVGDLISLESFKQGVNTRLGDLQDTGRYVRMLSICQTSVMPLVTFTVCMRMLNSHASSMCTQHMHLSSLT